MGNPPVVWARFLFGIPPPFLPLYILTQSTRRGGAAKKIFLGEKRLIYGDRLGGNIGVIMSCGYLVRRILSTRIRLWRGRDLDMNGVVGC